MAETSARLCKCGCGMQTQLASKTCTSRGWRKGEPLTYINGHNARRFPPQKLGAQIRYKQRLQQAGLCLQCGKGKAERTVLCEPCRLKDRARRAKPIRQCLLCERPCAHRSGLYCDEHRRVVCKWCGCVTVNDRGRARMRQLCSLECVFSAQRHHRGIRGHNWRGGLSTVNHIERGRSEVKEWRLAVFARDNWTCQRCGKRGGGELHAHHIKPFAQFPALRRSMDNGLTLCLPCHRAIHREESKNGSTVDTVHV